MWLLLAFTSALLLGLYDVAKKQALRDNAVLPVLLGLVWAGVLTRFGRTGGWVLYFLFIGGCFSTDKWLHLLAEQPWMVVFPVGVLAALAVCGAKWLMKAAVK